MKLWGYMKAHQHSKVTLRKKINLPFHPHDEQDYYIIYKIIMNATAQFQFIAGGASFRIFPIFISSRLFGYLNSLPRGSMLFRIGRALQYSTWGDTILGRKRQSLLKQFYGNNLMDTFQKPFKWKIPLNTNNSNDRK